MRSPWHWSNGESISQGPGPDQRIQKTNGIKGPVHSGAFVNFDRQCIMCTFMYCIYLPSGCASHDLPAFWLSPSLDLRRMTGSTMWQSFLRTQCFPALLRGDQLFMVDNISTHIHRYDMYIYICMICMYVYYTVYVFLSLSLLDKRTRLIEFALINTH